MDSSQIKRGITPNGHSHDSNEILSDIRHTRERMDHTLDELGDKLQPRHMVEDAVDYFWTRERDVADKAKQSINQIGHKVVDEVREHPLPSLMIGAGLIWLLSQQKAKGYAESEGGPGLKQKAGKAFDSAKEKLQQGTESVKERASEMGDKAREKIGSAWDSTREKSSEMKDKAKGYYQQTAQSVRHTADTHPLAVGIGCIAAGILAGVMAPRTRVEDEAFGATADRLKHEGKQQAEDLAEKGKQVAARAVEAGQEEARRQDLTPEDLTGKSEEMKAGEPQAGPGI